TRRAANAGCWARRRHRQTNAVQSTEWFHRSFPTLLSHFGLPRHAKPGEKRGQLESSDEFGGPVHVWKRFASSPIGPAGENRMASVTSDGDWQEYRRCEGERQ